MDVINKKRPNSRFSLFTFSPPCFISLAIRQSLHTKESRHLTQALVITKIQGLALIYILLKNTYRNKKTSLASEYQTQYLDIFDTIYGSFLDACQKLVRYSNVTPFDNGTHFHHLNTGQVKYSGQNFANPGPDSTFIDKASNTRSSPKLRSSGVIKWITWY